VLNAQLSMCTQWQRSHIHSAAVQSTVTSCLPSSLTELSFLQCYHTPQQIGDKLYLRYRRYAHDKARTMHQKYLQQRLSEAQRCAATTTAATAAGGATATSAAAVASSDAVKSVDAPRSAAATAPAQSGLSSSASSSSKVQLPNTPTTSISVPASGTSVYASATVAAADVKVSTSYSL
jgi:hypothetical protein